MVDAAGRFMVKGRDVLNQKMFPFFFNPLTSENTFPLFGFSFLLIDLASKLSQ